MAKLKNTSRKTLLFCLESGFDDEQPFQTTRAQGILRTLSDMSKIYYNSWGEHLDIHYGTANTVEEFEFYSDKIRKLSNMSTSTIIYLASHGRRGTLDLGDNDYIEFIELPKILHPNSSTIIHIHGCSTAKDAEGIKKILRETSAYLLTGYKMDIEVFSGMIVDLVVLSAMVKYWRNGTFEEANKIVKYLMKSPWREICKTIGLVSWRIKKDGTFKYFNRWEELEDEE